MKINWKVRVQSGAFWAGVLSAVAAAVFAILDLCGVQTGVTVDKIINVGMLVLAAFSAIGVISDPTTKGVFDSAQALTYTTPKSDKEDK